MGSIAVGLLLIVIAYILAVEMKSLLIGEAVDSIDMNNIRAAILDGSEAKSIIHIRTMHLGPEDILLGVKIESGANNLREVTNDINTIESRIRAILPSVKTIYIEPDILKNKDI